MAAAAAVLAAACGGARADREDDKAAAAAAAEAAEREFAQYAPFALSWRVAQNVGRVRAVWPHPYLPARVVLADAEGLLISDDAGRTWRRARGADASKLGAVRHVAFSPDEPQTFYLATARAGVWASRDGGKTFVQLGSKSNGLASDRVACVYIDPTDLRFQTLCALHGSDACGISRSFDGGKTWSVTAGEYHVRRIFRTKAGWGGGQRMIVIAAEKARPEVWSAFSCSALGDLWSESVRDAVFTGGAEWAPSGELYLSTADRGLMRVNEAGGFRVGPPDVGGFACVGVTWGPRADKELVYAYEPRRGGLLVSLDGMKTFGWHRPPAAAGFVGPFVREGAHVRANANGRRFYGAINRKLYVASVRARPVGVVAASVDPPVFAYRLSAYETAMSKFRREMGELPQRAWASRGAARLLACAKEAQAALSAAEFHVTARVAGPAKVKSVTLDMGAVNGPADAPMLDDGEHGDGAAGDGTYGLGFSLDPRKLHVRRREPGVVSPGRWGLSVKVACEDGHLGGAVAVLSVYDRPEGFVLWDEGRKNPLKAELGRVELPERPGYREAFSGETCMKFSVPGGPWRVGYVDTRRPWNLVGYEAMSFWVRAEAAAPETGKTATSAPAETEGAAPELNVQLRDSPEFDMPVTGPKLGVVRDRLIEGGRLDATYRRVVIPLSRLTRGAEGFRFARVGGLLFSGSGQSPATFWIDRIVFHVKAADAAVGKPVVDPNVRRKRRR